MSDKMITNEDCIPTKELLRRQRKAHYEKQKALQKAERLADKAKAREDKLEERAKRDQEILDELQTANKLTP